jgi:hypothetical protein
METSAPLPPAALSCDSGARGGTSSRSALCAEMATDSVIDVLIAGAGPVGLSLAVDLARYGVSVRVLSKALERSPYSKAFGVHIRWAKFRPGQDGCLHPSDTGF